MPTRSRGNRFVALKVLHPWYSSSKPFVERFQQEAQAASDLNHPNICLVLDIGCAESRHYYAMQYCEGSNLAEHLVEHGRISATEVSSIIIELAEALEVAHRRGIIHRDLKPANLLLQANGSPLITDFGLAQDEREAAHGDPLQIAGTPGYMAPEQMYEDGAMASVGLDVYSLGAILFEMISGNSPAAIPFDTARRDAYLDRTDWLTEVLPQDDG